MPDNVATRVFGGSPLTVLVRLLVVSLLVGAAMSWLGIDAADILRDIERGALHLWGTGFAALGDIGRTVAAGAAIVVPVWIVLRILSFRGPRHAPADPQDPRVQQARPARPSRWSEPDRVGDERRF